MRREINYDGTFGELYELPISEAYQKDTLLVKCIELYTKKIGKSPKHGYYPTTVQIPADTLGIDVVQCVNVQHIYLSQTSHNFSNVLNDYIPQLSGNYVPKENAR